MQDGAMRTLGVDNGNSLFFLSLTSAHVWPEGDTMLVVFWHG